VWNRAVSRRAFLGTAAAAALAAQPLARAALAAPSRLPVHPAKSGLDHVVVVMMENRSFDHILGWLPGADGKQAGLSFTDKNGVAHQTFSLAPDFQGCAYHDPGHEVADAVIEWNSGACDGWLRTAANDVYSIGYYRRQDLPFLGKVAPAFTTCDRYFAPFLGPTFPNRFYSLSGATDRIDDAQMRIDLPTIFDRFFAKRIPAAYYYGNFPFLVLYQRYTGISHRWSTFYKQCRTGKLPAFSYIDPNYTFTDTGPSSGNQGNDDHPHADIRAGEYFMSQVYNAVVRSPAWPRTLLIFTFDEWGGFFDHVPPPTAQDPNPAHRQRGFRVPCILISPFARRGHVAHGVYDHTSILKLLEWRFGLEPMTMRDATANNLAGALDFTHRNLSAPRITPPVVTVGAACP
jgi:phospholipase C